MTPNAQGRMAAGLSAAFLLGNLWLLAWGIFLFGSSRLESPPPEAREEAWLDALAAAPAPSASAAMGAPPERLPPAAQAPAPPAASPRAARGEAAPTAKPAPAPAAAAVEAAYISVLRQPRFWRSPTLRAWAREFVSYPDLRAIDERYNHDGDPFRFLADTVRSPNFQAMAARYLLTADVRLFLRELASSPVVSASLPALLKDGTMGDAARLLEGAGVLDPRAGITQGRRRR